MTVIEITPHRWGWKASEAPGVEPVFPTKDDAISYAQARAHFRAGEIRVLDSKGMSNAQVRSTNQIESSAFGRVFRSRSRTRVLVAYANAKRRGRGPDLTYIGDTLSESDIVIRIVNSGVNMPAYSNSINPNELKQLTAFLQSRKRPMPAGLEATYH